MSNYKYAIKKLNTKSWIKYWLWRNRTGGTKYKFKLSEILTNTRFNLQNTINRKFNLLEIPNEKTIYINNRNFLENANIETVTRYGVTAESLGNGKFHVYGTPTAVFGLQFNIKDTFIPANSYIHMRNRGTATYNLAISLRNNNVNIVAPPISQENYIRNLNMNEDFYINAIAFICNSSMIGIPLDIYFELSIELNSNETTYTNKETQIITNENIEEAKTYNEETNIYSIENDFDIKIQYWERVER